MNLLNTSKAEQRFEDRLEALGKRKVGKTEAQLEQELPVPFDNQRIIKAIRRTFNVIGTDMGWDERREKLSVVMEVVADADYMEQNGGDREAVKRFRAMGKAARAVLLNEALGR